MSEYLPSLSRLLRQQGLPAATAVSPVSGGCINRGYRFRSGERWLFYKTHPTPPEQFFASEAAGLKALAATDTVSVPEVVAFDEQGLLLSYLEPDRPSRANWIALGEQLAALHSQSLEDFGFTQDNYCGLTRQPNPPTADGWHFFAYHRLLWQAELARRNRRLEKTDLVAVEKLCERLPELIPRQPPCLLHGDLWSGNLLFSGGAPWLIDPAVWQGQAEAELAMTRLFGGFPEIFYSSYLACHPLEPEWEERSELYNLYHLLNHLNLFGGSYLADVRSVLRRYQPAGRSQHLPVRRH